MCVSLVPSTTIYEVVKIRKSRRDYASRPHGADSGSTVSKVREKFGVIRLIYISYLFTSSEHGPEKRTKITRKMV